MSRVKITPPSNKRVHITPPQGNQIPMAKYGAAIDNSKQHMFEFDNRWNPGSYQGQIGVNPDPDPYARTGNTLPEVPDHMANVNAEKQEQVLGNFTPDGLPSLMNVDGPPHTEGGKNLNLPDNSFIFSDTKSLKIKDPEVLKQFGQSKPMTPAAIAKQYQLQKFTKVLADPKSDPVSKKTAELMVGNYTDKLQQLAQVQEGMKNHMGIGDNQQQPQLPVAQYGIPGQGMDRHDDVFDVNSYGNNSQSQNSQSTIGNARRVRIQPPNQYYVPQPEQNWMQNQLGISGSQNIDQTPLAPIVQLPTSIPQPTNMSQVSNPDTRLGSYGITDTKQQTNVPFTSPTPDKLGLANSLLNAATIHRYPGWIAPNGAVTPNTVFEDPTRAIAAIQENANSQTYNNALSGNHKAAIANNLASQGIAGEQSANVAASVNNRNVETSNRASAEVANIANRLHEQNAARLSKMYEQNVISSQQYDNALRESRNDAVKQAQTAWNDRSKLSFLNATSPYFYDNPSTGARGFKSEEARSHFLTDVLGINAGESQGKNVTDKFIADYNNAIRKGARPEDAAYLAKEQSGARGSRTTKTNAYGVPISSSYREPEDQGDNVSTQKFGGRIKPMKFGGMSQHQLKKFVARSFSK